MTNSAFGQRKEMELIEFSVEHGTEIYSIYLRIEYCRDGSVGEWQIITHRKLDEFRFRGYHRESIALECVSELLIKAREYLKGVLK